MRNRRARFGLLAAAAASVAVTTASESYAWKPYTHVYLAQQAWADAIDDGRVTIYKIDDTGQIAKDAQKRPIAIGTYRVQARILQAIKAHPDKFFAGVLGPDAYPDIVTGQMRIHPPGPTQKQIDDDPHFKPDSNADGPGTDAWLQQLWAKAWASNDDNAIAWAAGFLSHAAGDVYAHSFMNTFAGGIFDISDMQGLNWFKHITVEGYVGERTPDLSPIAFNNSQASIFDIVRDNGIATGANEQRLDDFIAQNTWDISVPGGGSIYPDEANKKLSVPYLLHQFGDYAGAFGTSVSHYDGWVTSQLSQAAWMASPAGIAAELDWACGGSTCPDHNYSAATCPTDQYPHGDSAFSGTCAGMTIFGGIGVWASAWASVSLAWFNAWLAEHPAALALEGWSRNATSTVPLAMRDWIHASHNAAIHLFFTSDHLMHTDGDEFPDGATLGDGYKPFKIDLEAIATGLNPQTVAALNTFIDFVKWPYTLVQTAVGDAEKWMMNQVFQAMFHMTVDQAKTCYQKPHLWFNPLLKTNTTGTQANLMSANTMMRLPASPGGSACVGANTQCTLNSSLRGMDVNGACDILTTQSPAKFSVKPDDPQGVFPAAFNTVNMIKLLLMDPADVATLANTVKSATTQPMSLGPAQAPAPANAMLGFAATIDGSHEWLGRRFGDRMILARDCTAYRSVFLDQRPNVNMNLQPVTGAEPKLLPQSNQTSAWEPDDVSCAAPAKLDLPRAGFAANALGGTRGAMTVSANAPANFTAGSAAKNGNTSSVTRGSVVVSGDGLSAKYVPPKWSPFGQDQIVVVSKDGMQRNVVTVKVDPPVTSGFVRELPKTPVPGKGDPIGLHAGETARLVGFASVPMTWTIVSGPGTIGDPKVEATHAAAINASMAKVADNEKLLTAQRASLHSAACKGTCRTDAGTKAVTLARTRVAARIEAGQTQQKLDEARATYHAPDTIAKDDVVTIRGVGDGRTVTAKIRLLAPPAPLKLKNAPTSVRAASDLKLEIDHGFPAVKGVSATIPMTWVVVSGPGTVGDPAMRAKHMTQKQAFLSSLDPLNRQLANAQPWEMDGVRQAWLSHVNANISKYAASFAALDENDRTYHAPKIAQKQRVTLRGTAQDGTGRTIDVSFDVVP